MIQKFRFGTPIETLAIEKEILIEKSNNLPFLSIKAVQNKTLIGCTLTPNQAVYGLGESIRGINKRGWHYESYCNDDAGHTENKTALYGAHNFLLFDGENPFGVFIDFPGYVAFDIGYSQINFAGISIDGINFDLYIVTGENLLDITTEFRKLIGQPYVPPLWAFGYQQSRWGYRNKSDVDTLIENFKKHSIPLDAINLDIDYMEDYKDFTLDETKFPDFSDYAKGLKKQGIHLVPIIDAGVKIKQGYDVYEQGVEHNHFCKRSDGTDFVAGVWPGKTHFPDFFQPKTRAWFGALYQRLLELGVDGFWNDMNEPAIFYSEEGLAEAFSQYEEITQKPLDVTGFFALLDNFNHLANNHKDYDRFFHNIDGKLIPHREVHNLYGFYMTMAAGQAFEKIAPDKRILLFSRASYIGMHRYGGIWTGDNQSWWSHLLLGIQMMPALSMCGFLYTGTDIGGFGSDTTEDLMLRWLQFGIFTPLMRNHSAFNTREQEPYQFSLVDAMAKTIGLRYSMIPFIYTEFMDCTLNNNLFFKPLAFDFPEDKEAKAIDDQLMLGDSVMIAPIYKQNASGRYVYLPEDMLLVVMKSYDERRYQYLEKGHHYIDVALDETPLFIRKNHFIPLVKPTQNTSEIDINDIELLGYLEEAASASYTLYWDDGYSKDYNNPSYYHEITAKKENGSVQAKSTLTAKLSLTFPEL